MRAHVSFDFFNLLTHSYITNALVDTNAVKSILSNGEVEKEMEVLLYAYDGNHYIILKKTRYVAIVLDQEEVTNMGSVLDVQYYDDFGDALDFISNIIRTDYYGN